MVFAGRLSAHPPIVINSLVERRFAVPVKPNCSLCPGQTVQRFTAWPGANPRGCHPPDPETTGRSGADCPGCRRTAGSFPHKIRGFSSLKLSTHLPNLKNDLRWILLLVIIFSLIILAWPDPASGAVLHQAATASPVVTLTPSAIPAEFLSTTDQTSGIICGSAFIVLIIVGGTVGVLRRNSRRVK